jgi:hypothetical protein
MLLPALTNQELIRILLFTAFIRYGTDDDVLNIFWKDTENLTRKIKELLKDKKLDIINDII